MNMRMIELSLRSSSTILSLIGISIMVATVEERQGAGSTFKMKFNDFQAYNYLVAVNVGTFVYSLWQVVYLARLCMRGDPDLPYNQQVLIYASDQVLSFLQFSASTAAATAAQLSRQGLQNIWPPACSTWRLWVFCSKADAAVAMTFFCSFCVIGSAVLSAHHLLKWLHATVGST